MKNLLRKLNLGGNKRDFNSKEYWESRYGSGGNSGSGSYGKLAAFKASVINDFIVRNNITSIIEFGCGDGNQLKLAKYPRYIGLDVSTTIIKQCSGLFATDDTKSFFLYDGEAFVDRRGLFSCDLSLSLDVLYHLVEDEVYKRYLEHLFQSANQYVIIYSSNRDVKDSASHERHRQFTKDVQTYFPGWSIMSTIENEHKPENWEDEEGSIANFYIYKKKD
jgi:hypothetical protein